MMRGKITLKMEIINHNLFKTLSCTIYLIEMFFYFVSMVWNGWLGVEGSNYGYYYF